MKINIKLDIHICASLRRGSAWNLHSSEHAFFFVFYKIRYFSQFQQTLHQEVVPSYAKQPFSELKLVYIVRCINSCIHDANFKLWPFPCLDTLFSMSFIPLFINLVYSWQSM